MLSTVQLKWQCIETQGAGAPAAMLSTVQLKWLKSPLARGRQILRLRSCLTVPQNDDAGGRHVPARIAP